MNDCAYTDQQLSHYHLIRSLGRSSFSEVYLGEHTRFHTPVAIKRLQAPLAGEEAQGFLTRASELSRLRHPHIVPILDFGVEGEIAFLVMAYAPHGTLRQRHPRGTQVPFELIPGYITQIAAGLYYLHERGLVHRDIKPHNILLGTHGEALLSDFGTAIDSYSLRPGQASLQDFEGTVLYAAPEQLRGMPRRSSDQYALGVMVYEWICGSWPFNGTFHEVVHHHLFITPPPLEEKGIACPPNIAQVVMRALEKDPVKRFPSVKVFADEFEWAYKVAQAKRQLPHPTTFPQKQAVQEQDRQLPLSLPLTPPPVEVFQPPQRTKRQFRSPLPEDKHAGSAKGSKANGGNAEHRTCRHAH